MSQRFRFRESTGVYQLGSQQKEKFCDKLNLLKKFSNRNFIGKIVKKAVVYKSKLTLETPYVCLYLT